MGTFERNLKKLRKQKDWNSQKFSEEIKNMTGLEISHTSLSRYENNKRDPSLESLVGIAKTLEVKIDQLLLDEDTIFVSPNYSDVLKKLDRIEKLIDSLRS